MDARNTADQVVYQSEKTLDELGDKVTESEKAPIQAAIEKLRETLKGSDTAAIKADTEALPAGILQHLREALSAAGCSAGRCSDAGSAGTTGKRRRRRSRCRLRGCKDDDQ